VHGANQDTATFRSVRYRHSNSDYSQTHKSSIKGQTMNTFRATAVGQLLLQNFWSTSLHFSITSTHFNQPKLKL